jgi:D-3-phosphoglycerate dehydrogenase
VRFALSGTTKGAVNFPEVPYQDAAGATRILHVHRNEPGAMGKLSSIMASHGLNIVRQQLQTNSQVGYVLSDVEGEVTDAVITALRNDPITIRCDRI